MSSVLWAYGVTTVPGRRWTTLPKTLDSLRAAGFVAPRLYIDGRTDSLTASPYPYLQRAEHDPPLRAYGCWLASLLDLYIRFPNYHRFAIFQDDIVLVRNLKGYLDGIPLLPNTYWNLYTNAETQSVAPRDGVERSQKIGFFPTPQNGRGALALVFDLGGVQTLLTSKHMIHKVNAADPKYRHSNIDGGVVQALRQAGYRELAHNPSLVEHTGEYSVIGGNKTPWPKTISFPGEDTDAMVYSQQW